jgi:hypothetical protein
LERLGQPGVFIHCHAAVLFRCEHEAGVIPDPEGDVLEDEPGVLAQSMVAAGEVMRSNSQAAKRLSEQFC